MAKKPQLLQKQGFYNSLILYAGTALGFFNLVILFQRYLTIEEIGFFNLMVAITMLYAQFAAFGIGNVILKYYPVYTTADKKHGGFGTFILVWSIISFIVFTLLFVVFKNPVISFYSKKHGASLLVKYYYYLVPVAFFTMAYATLESMARAIYKNVLSAFLREVLLRIFTSISILLIASSLTDYHGFLMIYLASSALIAIILAYSIYREKHFKIVKIAPEILVEKRSLVYYGIFTVLSGTSVALIQNLDVYMLSIFADNSLTYVGIYSTLFSIAIVISMPAKAMNRTSIQIISQAWAQNDLPKIDKIYYKTSVVQMLIGFILFIGLVINKPLITLLLHKPEYGTYFNVLIVVGIGFLVDITGGLNGYIMNISKYYKLTTYLIGLAAVTCALANWLLIPRFGIIGAALAYTITTFVLNFAYWLFLKVKFNLQPFGKAHVLILLVSLVTLAIGWYLPAIRNIWVDFITRSTLVTVVYIVLSYFLNISEDINLLINKILRIGNAE